MRYSHTQLQVQHTRHPQTSVSVKLSYNISRNKT